MHTDLRVKGLSFQESIIIIYADMIFPRIDCVIQIPGYHIARKQFTKEDKARRFVQLARSNSRF